MFKKFFYVLLVLSMPFTASAADMGKSYFSVRGEVAFGSPSEYTGVDVDTGNSGKSDYDTGIGGGIAIGHYPTNYLRTELAVDFRHVDLKKPSINGTFLSKDDFATNIFDGMLNVYFDIFENEQMSPYLGGGLGMAHEFDDGENAFAYQFMAGVNLRGMYDGVFFLGYKYFATSNFKGSYADLNLGTVNNKANIRDHIIELGYRFNF